MTFFLFRHGETYFSKTDTPYGDKVLTAELLDEGKDDIARLGSFLAKVPTDFNASSPIKRCLDTVEIIKKASGKNFSIDQRLGEWLHPRETFQELHKRLQSFLDDMQKQQYQSIAVCTHGACIAGLTHLIMEGKFAESEYHDYPQCGVIWEVSGNNLEEHSFRDS